MAVPQAMQLGRRLVHSVLLFLLAAGLFGCDHATKAAATSALAGGQTVRVVGDAVVLRWVPNDDVAFSLLHNVGLAPRATPAVLAAMAIGAMGLLVFVWWRSRRDGVMANVGFAMAAAGALGNIVDRLIHGYVVDFIHVERWPVFNVADILVVVGVALAFLAKRRNAGTLKEG